MSKKFSSFFTVVYNGIEANNQDEADTIASRLFHGFMNRNPECRGPDEVDQDESEEEKD